MANLRGAALLVLLVAFSVACEEDGGLPVHSPIAPTPIESPGTQQDDDVGQPEDDDVGQPEDDDVGQPEDDGVGRPEDGDGGHAPPRSQEITFTVELPYPVNSHNIRVGISEATVTCTNGCDGRQANVTDSQGSVTFTGQAPLTVQVEKLGHIPVRQRVSGGGRVNMGHEWPMEVGAAIRQLGLTSAIASGELLLIWGDRKYTDVTIRRGRGDLGGQYACPVIIIRLLYRDVMVRVLAHELMHAWQHRNSNNPPCGLIQGYVSSEEGRAWTAALERDLDTENGGPGPVPGFDGEDWSKDMWENQAEFYRRWYWGEEPARLCRLAPNRCRYLEDRFGQPPR